MVRQIRSMTDRIFCHFGPFLPFYGPNNPANQNFEKLKKTFGDIIILNMCEDDGPKFLLLCKKKKMPGDIIILHKCTKNYDHMLYCSLKLVSAIFYQIFIFSPYAGPSKTMKNVFYFI